MRDRYLCKAKRTDNGEWVEGYIVEYPSGKMEIYKKAIEVLCICEVDPSTICQCTGLTDKNSKKIWENDIVKTYEASSKEYLTNIVKYYKGSFKVLKEHYLSMYIGGYELKDLEVIGNVFDNPELLEGEEKQNG